MIDNFFLYSAIISTGLMSIPKTRYPTLTNENTTRNEPRNADFVARLAFDEPTDFVVDTILNNSRNVDFVAGTTFILISLSFDFIL